MNVVELFAKCLYGQVTFDEHRGPFQSVAGTMSSAWSSIKVGMAAANQSARAMADAEMEAHSYRGGGDYTNSREAPRIGFSSVVEGVMATAKAANQQVRAHDCHLQTQRGTFGRSSQ